MSELRCTIEGYESPARWRWVLTERGGVVLADHDVRLDEGCWQYGAFSDLQRWLSLRTAPDRWGEEEAEILTELGEWIGERVFGSVGTALVGERPATVRVVVPSEPEEARQLMYRPLELAQVDGLPIAVQGVTLVMQIGDQELRSKAAVGERLRVLGLFSLPTGDRPLDLRRERRGLAQLFDQIATSTGRAVDVRMLQYGVTRERLREILEEDEGWDIVHVSSHGEPGTLFLEKDDGSADPVQAGELVGLLEATRERLKLVTVSACSSAAEGAEGNAEQQFGWPNQALSAVSPGEQAATEVEPAAERPAAALATELVDELDCAVLAMRLRVEDDFAIRLGQALYKLLVREGRPLARALGVALKEVSDDSACSTLSVAIPALFGARAVDLRLAAPECPHLDSPERKSREFDPPEHFVGRVEVMAPASAALAPRSGASGVLLLGMDGAGKTACALELANTHEHVFTHLVWFDAHPQGRDIGGALKRFVLTLESELPGFQVVGRIDSAPWIQRHVPVLTEAMRRQQVLIVLNNVESLLDTSGSWRDPRWNDVITALVDHSGPSRLIMTSCRRPDGLHPRVRVQTIGVLSRDEALHLARQLPNLARLIDGQVDGLDPVVSRALAKRVLEVAQGHPGLLQQANAQAADLNRLQALLEAAGQAWRQTGGLPDGFFTTGKPGAAERDYLHVLRAWTRAAIAALTLAERDVFLFFCCLEGDDRLRWVMEGTWKNLWERLGRTSIPPSLGVELTRLASQGLISIQPGTDQQWESYRVHPVVEAEGSDAAGLTYHTAVDNVLGGYWGLQSHYARESAGAADSTWMVVWAGLNAAPYLLRLGKLELAAEMLEQALFRDRSPETVAQALPMLETITTSLKGTTCETTLLHLLARAWEVSDLAMAEQVMQQVLATALTQRDNALASMAAGALSEYRERSGRLKEALTFAEDRITYVRRAGLGPWTQLGAETQRLSVLATMGQAEQVLETAFKLRTYMAALPHDSGKPDIAHPFRVRENLLNVGATAALRRKRWDDALVFIAEQVGAKLRRGAPATEIARAEFNAYGALLALDREDDAERLLLKCRAIFEGVDDVEGLDTEGLGKALGAVSDLDDDYGRGGTVIRTQRGALRYSYRTRDVQGIQTAHHNLGRYLAWYADDAAGLAHLLAAALICAVTGIEGADESVEAMAFFHTLIEYPTLPGDVAALCRRVAETPGVDLDELLARLAPHQASVAQAFAQVLAQAWNRGIW